MGTFNRLVEESSNDGFGVDSAICMDCGWDGLLTECTDTETDEDFGGNQVEVPICPKCCGGLDDYYPSELNEE